MKHILLSMTVLIALTGAAQADCFVEYKAKRDNPLRLHYGVLALAGGCPNAAAVQDQTARRLSAGGWTLLTVQSAKPTPPSDSQRANAGDFYLRF